MAAGIYARMETVRMLPQPDSMHYQVPVFLHLPAGSCRAAAVGRLFSQRANRTGAGRHGTDVAAALSRVRPHENGPAASRLNAVQQLGANTRRGCAREDSPIDRRRAAGDPGVVPRRRGAAGRRARPGTAEDAASAARAVRAA